MNIVLLGTAFFSSDAVSKPSKTNGIAALISELLQYLLEANFQIIFIGKIYHFSQTLHRELAYHEVYKNEVGTIKFLFGLLIKGLTVKINKNSIIHVHRPDHLLPFAFFKKNPAIVTIHGQQAITIKKRKGKLIRFIYNILERYAFKKAMYITVTDDVSYKYYTTRYKNITSKIHIIPTAVDLDKFRPMNKNFLRTKYGFSLDSKICLYIGRIEPPKRIYNIINAFEMCMRQVPNVKLVIVGDGKDREKMVSHVETLGITDDVYFLGNRSRDELPEIINCGDILVLYSSNEGSPMSVKESLACGIPVVANNVGDILQTITEGKTGFIVRNESDEELTKKILLCMESSHKMREYCLNKAREFSKDLIFEKFTKIYQDCVRN